MPNNIVFNLPSQESLEGRFSFIQDDTLRANIVIAFRYIYFLISLEEEQELPGPISYSLYKDMIVHTASIVESCAYYTLKSFLDAEIIKSTDVMGWEWKEDSTTILMEHDEKQAVGMLRHKAYKRFGSHVGFKQLNDALKKAEIHTKTSYECAEELRETRNKIHLAGLDEIDDTYSKSDVDRYFNNARKVLDRFEKKLETIPDTVVS